MNVHQLKVRYGDEFFVDEVAMSHSAQQHLFVNPNIFSTPWTIIGCDGEYSPDHDTYNALVCWHPLATHYEQYNQTIGEYDELWNDDGINFVLEEQPENKPLIKALTTTKRSSWKRFCQIPMEESSVTWYVYTDKNSPYFQHVIQFSREDYFDSVVLGSFLDEDKGDKVVQHILKLFNIIINDV